MILSWHRILKKGTVDEGIQNIGVWKKYENKLRGIDLKLANPKEVDNSIEYFLDEIEKVTDYNLWYCGHYHTDKKVDKIIFMFHKIEEFK